MEKIVLEEISKTYREVDGPVLSNISLELSHAEVVAIMGRSGSGKSTLLGILSGAIAPSSGKVLYGNQDYWASNEAARSKLRAENTATVFQSYNLIEYLTVEENIKLATRISRKPISNETILDLLAQVGLPNAISAKPRELSGGQQQRVAIARAFATEPQYIFADEPTGALDEKTANIVMELFRGMCRRGTCVVLVTHDPEIAIQADKVVIMKDGKIEKTLERPVKSNLVKALGYFPSSEDNSNDH
ncbi:ABC transporter ATP-binding protein [Corynebacterium pseudodiphtheriticum]|uniref:ABC transporter ATP-binding protein n=1 Tax=Corynebacterium pseudodiphtheriticum TaxID=37637 RepID=UPI00254AF821|nr:ABC transporter ATP-binding protein [Corynebacterium pseudodiphtheriticum]MDK8551783.1 ABC transporter ATP-binding protein [Corynebacterium pseudodiphtheriticum]MDK8563434.1 ABC transporter ATP-binding protein [Corynebacterium pseudodiphtheriticum]